MTETASAADFDKKSTNPSEGTGPWSERLNNALRDFGYVYDGEKILKCDDKGIYEVIGTRIGLIRWFRWQSALGHLLAFYVLVALILAILNWAFGIDMESAPTRHPMLMTFVSFLPLGIWAMWLWSIRAKYRKYEATVVATVLDLRASASQYVHEAKADSETCDTTSEDAVAKRQDVEIEANYADALSQHGFKEDDDGTVYQLESATFGAFMEAAGLSEDGDPMIDGEFSAAHPESCRAIGQTNGFFGRFFFKSQLRFGVLTGVVLVGFFYLATIGADDVPEFLVIIFGLLVLLWLIVLIVEIPTQLFNYAGFRNYRHARFAIAHRDPAVPDMTRGDNLHLYVNKLIVLGFAESNDGRVYEIREDGGLSTIGSIDGFLGKSFQRHFFQLFFFVLGTTFFALIWSGEYPKLTTLAWGIWLFLSAPLIVLAIALNMLKYAKYKDYERAKFSILYGVNI